MTKLTFVVTSYNYEKYINETLESIKNQSFKDFEIIIVDDFSTDNSINVINEFINKNPNLKVKLIKHNKNFGQLKACITGLSEASGEYISFIDSDDVLYEDYAKILLYYLSKTDVGFISSKYTKINKFGEESKYKTTNGKLIKLNLFTAPFGGWFWSPMSTALFKKSTLNILMNYDTTEDWKICPDKFLFNFVNLTNKSANLNEVLVKKRVHLNNAGNFNRRKINIENNLKIRICTLKFFNKFYKKHLIKYSIIIYLSYFYLPIQVLKYVKKSTISKFFAD